MINLVRAETRPHVSEIASGGVEKGSEIKFKTNSQKKNVLKKERNAHSPQSDRSEGVDLLAVFVVRVVLDGERHEERPLQIGHGAGRVHHHAGAKPRCAFHALT